VIDLRTLFRMMITLDCKKKVFTKNKKKEKEKETNVRSNSSSLTCLYPIYCIASYISFYR